MSLFVGNLSNKVTYTQLCEVFEPKGPCVIKPKVRPPCLPISWDFHPFIWIHFRPTPFFGYFQKYGGRWAHTFMVNSPSMKSISQWSPFHHLADWGQLNFLEMQPLKNPFSILPLHFHILPLHHHCLIWWNLCELQIQLSIHPTTHPNPIFYLFRENMLSLITKMTQMPRQPWRISSTRISKASKSTLVSTA